MDALPEWFGHTDKLAPLGDDRPFSEKLEFLHEYLRTDFPWIDRIAVALYDPATDMLKTFAHSSMGENPLALYEARLQDSKTLQEIVALRRPRVVNDLELLQATRQHSERIRRQGYSSSYTLPIFRHGEFLGLLFFNSYSKNKLNESSLHHLDLIGHLVCYSLIDQLTTTRNLIASVRSASTLAQHRDFETGAHLDRMAHYARLIAKAMAPKYGFSDDLVEHIFLFAPLHDIGKISIPDSILLKPGKLTEDEFEAMKAHPGKGAGIIDIMLEQFGLAGLPHSSLLRNIALHHHEAMNGKGYPMGLKGDEIPIEARIAAVADIFDALTSNRPYKQAWSNEEAFEMLNKLAGDTLDQDCVAGLIQQSETIRSIQARFSEDELG